MKKPQITDKYIVREYVRGRDIGYYLRNMVYTFNTETGEIERWGTGFTEEYKEKLIAICRQIVEVSVKGRKNVVFPPDFLILKSRQTMLSWTLSGVMAHQLIYHRSFYGLITSDKDESLDNAIYTDYNTAVGKVHYILAHMPEYLRPAPEDIKRSDKFISYLPTQAIVKADCGLEPGRGKGVNIAFQDEIAKQRFGFTKQSALTEAVKGANVMNSTPDGKFNVFYKTYDYATHNPTTTSYQVHKIHWREKIPAHLHDEFLRLAIARYNGDTARMAQELELSFDGIDPLGRVFAQFSPAKNVKKFDPMSFMPGHSFLVFDFGYGDPSVESLFTIVDKKLVWLDCLYASGEWPQKIGPQVDTMIKKWHLDKAKVHCLGDPSGSQVRGDNNGRSFFVQWAEMGYIINPADNAIAEGISEMNGCFNDLSLEVNEDLTAVIDALTQAVWPVDKEGNVKKTDYKIGAPYTDILDTGR